MTELQAIVLTALIQTAITWGVVSTKLAWMRRDIDDNTERLLKIEAELRHNDFENRMSAQEHRR